MSKKNPIVYIGHIKESIDQILKYKKGISNPEDLKKKLKSRDALLMRIAIIGEATKRIPKGFCEEHSNVPWEDMAGMRDIIIHDYNELDDVRLWETISKDVPKLQKPIDEILKQYQYDPYQHPENSSFPH